MGVLPTVAKAHFPPGQPPCAPEERGGQGPSAEVFTRTPARPSSPSYPNRPSLGVRSRPCSPDGAQGREGGAGKKGWRRSFKGCAGDGGGFS